MNKMYNLLFKRNVAKTKSRFFSIFLIVLLGTSFYAGLRNTPITMRQSMESFFEKNNFADLTLISSFAFDNSDIKAIEEIDGVKKVKGTYRTDATMTPLGSSTQTPIIAHSYDKTFHKPDIVEGRNIKNKGECLVDYKVGDGLLNKTITVKNDEGSIQLKVVGITNDIRYISNLQRGTNTYTSSTNEGFIIVYEDDLKTIAIPQGLKDLRDNDKLYNEVYIEYDTKVGLFDENYDDVNREIKANITDTMQSRIKKIKKDLVGDIEEQLEEPIKQYEKGLEEYNLNKDKLTATINDAKIKILDGKIQIIENKKKIIEAQNKLDQETANASGELNKLDETLKQYKQQLDNIPKLEMPENPDDLSSDDILNKTNEYIEEMQNISGDMVEQLDQTLAGVKLLINANQELSKANYELEKASLELQKQEAILENMEITSNRQLEEAKKQLDDAKIKIDEAKAKINEIPDGALYALTKDENAGFVSFDSDSMSIDSLSKVFPLLFFLVAALVSLTTMTRMVEEQRLQSGTLRALGYSKKYVMMLYVRYALLATLIASIIGIISGTIFFPSLVYYLYRSLMYQVSAPIIIKCNFYVVPLTLFISVAITLGVTLLVLYGELTSSPAELLRPKPPKLGKRILLERINFIWKRLSFNQKVTLRNMFRYKKRFFMSIVGIAGCCALIVTGVGLRNSVGQILPRQFGEVWTYDGVASLKEELNDEQIEKLQDDINGEFNVKNTLGLFESSAIASSIDHPSDFHLSYRILSKRYNDMIHYLDDDGNEQPLEDDGIIMTRKTSELLGVEEGDSVTLTISDKKYDVTISRISQNYSGHYIYMSKLFYENLTSQTVNYNQLLFTMKDDHKKQEKSLEKVLKDYDEIQSVYYLSSANDDFNAMLSSINIVIVIIIISAALLAFIVLYNLTNINIQERTNEIATIKVLGFYNNEVYDYVFRENTLLSIIGSIVGLGLGVILHQFIIRTVEVDATMFYRHINFMSLFIAVVLTMLFTTLINRFMRKSLRNIDMIASLKFIE